MAYSAEKDLTTFLNVEVESILKKKSFGFFFLRIVNFRNYFLMAWQFVADGVIVEYV